MKAKTRITHAVKEMYDAYAEYSLVKHKIPVIAPHPKVTWVAGNAKDGNAGWMIDGNLVAGTADQIVDGIQRTTNYWLDKAKRKTDPIKKAESNEQQ
jgi:hypothetical protein